MMNTTLVSSFGQTVLDSSKLVKKPKVKIETRDPEENQIIESYEGECEQCEEDKPHKVCPICGE